MDIASQIRIGTAGWAYKDWDGVFYPSEMQRRRQHPLEFIARCFDVVEINTSFYGHIKPELARLWAKRADAVNPKFVFTAKLHRSFTHSPAIMTGPTSAATINPNEEDARLAREGLNALASTGKLGALLIQFPVSYKNTPLNREYIEELLGQFSEFPRVVEVRHSSWDNPEALALMEQKGVSFCNIDQPQIGRALPPTEYVTSSIGYVRLHGRNYDQWFEAEQPHDRYNYLYSEDELLGWREKVKRIAQKAQITYVVANNHFEAKGAVNALQLKNMLAGRRLTAPEVLLRHYPKLRTIADPLPDDLVQSTLPLLA
jgi:uncharacterized protein YecE (DUF72 family)